LQPSRRKVKKTRVSVTMTKPYLDALDRLITEGVYLSRGEAVLEGLRLIFRSHGLDPFKVLETEG
jgi:Arc/MetJ-type ribon-helix-helix transcriptional regulator